MGLNDIKKELKKEASKDLVSELMLFYAETGVAFTNEFGVIDEPFYNSIASVYSNALILMAKENILNKFADRAKKIVDDTNGMGWGFHYELGAIYRDFYN